MKTLLTIKSKIYCAKLNISGLLLLVIDKEIQRFIGVNGVFVSGDSLKNTKTNISPIDFLEAINVATQQYPVQKEYFEVTRNYLLQRIDQKNISALITNSEHNQIAAINEVQRIIKNSLNIDSIDVYSEFDSISQSQYNEILLTQKINGLTMSQQIELAKPYYDNNTQIAEEAVKKNKNDIGIVTLFLDSSQFSGVCFCIVNCITRKLLYSFCWLDEPDIVQSEVKSADTNYDLFHKMVKASERINKFTPIQHEIQSKLWSIDINTLINAIEHEASAMAGQLFASVLKQFGVMQVRAEVHAINAVRLHMIYNPAQYTKKEEKEEGDSSLNKKMVAIDLILSPTLGKKVSQLQKGDFIYVFIDTSTPYGYDVAKKLNLIIDNKNTPIEAEVYAVNYNKKKGFSIFVKITESLYGKAVEEQDVKVKAKLDASIEDNTSSRSSLVIGLIAGLLVLIAIVLFFVLS